MESRGTTPAVCCPFLPVSFGELSLRLLLRKRRPAEELERSSVGAIDFCFFIVPLELGGFKAYMLICACGAAPTIKGRHAWETKTSIGAADGSSSVKL